MSDTRDETEDERADRNWNEILQEVRATQTGTQILAGFLLAVAFQPGFADIGELERALYLCLVILAGTATLLGVSPVIMHRLLFRQRQKRRIVEIGSRLLLVMLVIVSLLVSGVTGLIFDIALGRTAGVVALCAMLAFAAAAWVLLPRIGRRWARDSGPR